MTLFSGAVTMEADLFNNYAMSKKNLPKFSKKGLLGLGTISTHTFYFKIIQGQRMEKWQKSKNAVTKNVTAQILNLLNFIVQVPSAEMRKVQLDVQSSLNQQ